MCSEKKRLEHQIQHLQEILSTSPPGKIQISKCNGRYRWFQIPDNTNKPVYIPVSNRALAEDLAYKKYLMYLLDESIHECAAIDFYLRHHNSNPPKSQQLLTNITEYHNLLTPFFKSLSKELQEWASMQYTRNPNYPEKLIHKAPSGIMVRSKSEATIDMLLYTNNIPFRYECELILSGISFFPDFTIRHPATGKIYYWEHFGMMDDPTYYTNAVSKMHTFISNGILPFSQLIVTYETKNKPLSIDDIQRTVEQYFLTK